MLKLYNMKDKLIVRYVRVSTIQQNTEKYIKEDDEKNGIHIIEEKVSGYKVGLFDRPKGIILKEMIMEGRVKELIIYSVDRLSRSVKDLSSVIDFLHKYDVCLTIENLGVRSLIEKEIEGKVVLTPSPMINFMIMLQGCYSELNYWERREKQALGIEKAKIKKKYNHGKVRGNEKIEDWLKKPKNQRAINYLRENPSMKNCDVAKLCDLHYHSIRKIRMICKIPKPQQVA